MKYSIIIVLLYFNFDLFSQVEMSYDQEAKYLPYWVELMYEEKSNEGIVIDEYNKYYKKNKFKKNKYTQYYKSKIN